MAPLLFLIWLGSTGVNCALVLPPTLSGHWLHTLFLLLTLTPANLIWFGLLKIRLSRGGLRLGDYRARGDSLFYDEEFEWASSLLIVFGSYSCMLVAFSADLAAVFWMGCLALVVYLWSNAKEEALLTIRSDCVESKGQRPISRKDLREIQLTISKRRYPRVLLAGERLHPVPGGPEVARWLSHKLELPLIEWSESEAPTNWRLPPACPTREPWDLGGLFFGVFILLVLGIFTLAHALELWSNPGQLGLWPALALLTYLTVTLVRALIIPTPPRLIVLYEKPVAASDTFISGWALARNGLRLDRLAETAGVRSFSADGYADPLQGEKVRWITAEQALQTVSALIEATDKHPDALDCPAAVLQELLRLKQGLQLAARQNSRISWLIERMNGTSALVWERRGGHP